MKTSAYQKRQAASSKRAAKARARRIKNAAAMNAARDRRTKERNRHKCESYNRPMMSANGIRYDMASRSSATCYGGIELVHAIARQSGLVDAINQHVELLQSHFPYHESDMCSTSPSDGRIIFSPREGRSPQSRSPLDSSLGNLADSDRSFPCGQLTFDSQKTFGPDDTEFVRHQTYGNPGKRSIFAHEIIVSVSGTDAPPRNFGLRRCCGPERFWTGCI